MTKLWVHLLGGKPRKSGMLFAGIAVWGMLCMSILSAKSLVVNSQVTDTLAIDTIRVLKGFDQVDLGLSFAAPVEDTLMVQADKEGPEYRQETVEKTTLESTDKKSEEVSGSRLREELSHPPDVGRVISLGKLFWALIFILIGYFILKALSGILTLIAERRVRYKASIRRILPVVKIAGWTFVVYVIITGIIQPPIETVFAFLASVGVAVGFAAQDLLKNIFGGLMILFDKPFQIGDKIESGKYYGEVLEVGLRSTRIVTPDDSVVAIPNSEMMNQSISNANSSENNCQVVAEFFLPVTIDTRRTRQIAIEAAQISRYIYLNKPVVVEYSNVLVPRGSFLKMRLKAYVMDVRFEFPFQSEMTEVVLRELQKEGFLEGL